MEEVKMTLKPWELKGPTTYSYSVIRLSKGLMIKGKMKKMSWVASNPYCYIY